MIWLLTYEVNAYDQEGEYFIAAFESKPTADQLKPFLSGYRWKCEEGIEHLLNGGGRREYEDDWYYLVEYKFP